LVIKGLCAYKRYWLSCAWFVLAIALNATGQQSAGPVVTKIEPPQWWIGFPDPMVLLTGENLQGARVTTSSPSVRIARTMDGRNGHYLFVWLDISKAASPEKIILQISTAQGQKTAQLALEQRNPAWTGTVGQGFSGFTTDDVIYLIMPDRFADGDQGNNFPASGTYDRKQPRSYHGGDLRGIQDHLPYLKDLGITTIWITPIYDNDDHAGQDYHGYGAVDLYSIEEHFGTLAEYKSLVRAAHSLGLKVMLDIVPNHIGPAHRWAADPPTEHWLHGSRENHLTADAEFQHLVDPHASPREWRKILEGWFVGVLPDMGTDDPLTSQYLRQNAMWWAEMGGVDGFRLDTFPYVDRQFWHDFHSDLHHLYPRFRTVGEVSGFDPAFAAFFVGGQATAGIDTGVDTVFDFSLYSVLRKVILQNAPTKLLEEVLANDWLFPHPENLVTFLGNHDKPRFMGEAGATPQKLGLAFALLLTMRGIPELYAGDEIGMPGGDDPDNRRDFPGGFPGDTHNAFTAEGRSADEQQSFQQVRQLLHLRQQHPALRGGRYLHIFDDDRTFAFVRDFPGEGAHADGAEKLFMVMNNDDQPRTVNIGTSDTPLEHARSLTKILAASDATVNAANGITIQMPARSLSIYRVE
jgi:glycosidase